MTEERYVTQTDFNAFKEAFIRFEAANEERQKSIDHKLGELLEARKVGAEHDTAQAQIITELNNTVMAQGEMIGGLRESRDQMREKIGKQDLEIEAIKTEKKVLNWVLGVGISIAIIISPIIATLVGDWLTNS